MAKKRSHRQTTKRLARPKEDPKRENRIAMEIVVDAYTPEEQAMGWCCYLESNLRFPFQARCIAERAISPLRNNSKVTVVGMPPEKECEHEMFVSIQWEDRTLAVPLSQLQPIAADEKTTEAVSDWHYWVNRGHLL